MTHDSVPLPFDPERLITGDFSRDVLTRGLIANVIAVLGQFKDASLVHQILEHQRGEQWVFNAPRLGVIGVDQGLANSVHAWLVTLSALGPMSKSDWQRVARALNDPSLARYLATSAQAMLLDGSLAPFEGDKVVVALLKQPSWLGALKVEASQRTSDARSTPFGVPTDDSQFLVSGAHAAVSGAPSFVDAMLSDWAATNGEGLWRNIGSRYRAWLGGDAKAFAGPTMLGEFLRFTTLLPRLLVPSTAAKIDQDLKRLAQRLAWPDAKLEIARAFIAFQRARLGHHDAEATEHLDRLISLTSQEDTLTAAYLKVARDTLWQKTDLAAYVKAVTTVGKDYDTYGFLAPFFARRSVIDPRDFRFAGPNTQIHVATVIASTLASLGVVPPEVALRVRHDFLENERRIRDALLAKRAH